MPASAYDAFITELTTQLTSGGVVVPTMDSVTEGRLTRWRPRGVDRAALLTPIQDVVLQVGDQDWSRVRYPVLVRARFYRKNDDDQGVSQSDEAQQWVRSMHERYDSQRTYVWMDTITGLLWSDCRTLALDAGAGLSSQEAQVEVGFIMGQVPA